MHVIQRRQRTERKMYLPSERQVVNGVGLGLGSVDGLFNIGKMFTRLVTIKPSSFKFSNIIGAIGSATTAIATGGIAPILSEFAGPSGLKLTKSNLTSAHSALMKDVGYGTVAVAAVASGAALAAGPAAIGGTAATGTGLTTIGGSGIAESAGSSVIGEALAAGGGSAGTGFFSTVGSVLSTVGSGFMNVMQALPIIGQVMGGGSQPQPQQQQGGMTQAEYDAQQAYIAQQQAAMYQPGYNPGIPYVPGQYAGPVIDPNSSYGDLRTPYSAIAEDGSVVQVDPATGQVIPSPVGTYILMGGIALLAGWYLMSDSKSNN